MDSSSRQLDRNGSTEVSVTIDSFGKFGDPVKFHITQDGSRLRIDPADATITPPGEWKFRVVAPDERGIYPLKITATAEGTGTVERTIVIMVDPEMLYLPAISSKQKSTSAR
jgi:hypothetical protein